MMSMTQSVVFNGEARDEAPKRFHARGEPCGPTVDRELTLVRGAAHATPVLIRSTPVLTHVHALPPLQVLDTNGILGERTIADASALKSEPCVPPGTAAVAALLGPPGSLMRLDGTQSVVSCE